jgi:hypothetical protein
MNCRFVPIATECTAAKTSRYSITPSAGTKACGRHFEPAHLRSLEPDHDFKFSRRISAQFGSRLKPARRSKQNANVNVGEDRSTYESNSTIGNGILKLANFWVRGYN